MIGFKAKEGEDVEIKPSNREHGTSPKSKGKHQVDISAFETYTLSKLI